MHKITLKRELSGSILDIGGGGEGIIGRIYGHQVTAIDNRQEELDEAPEGFEKLCMDACALQFPDASFDHVTAFYALMYMSRDEQAAALEEAGRVLRPRGSLQIWDAAIASAYPDPFLAELDIDAAGERVRTTYGVVKERAAQDRDRIRRLCEEAGFTLTSESEEEGHFYLCLCK